MQTRSVLAFYDSSLPADHLNGIEEPILSYPNSQLTGKVVDQLLLEGDCGLTRFEESCKYHKPIIDALTNEYNRLSGNKGDLCPIT